MNDFQLKHCIYCQQPIENYDYSGNHYAHCNSNSFHLESIHYQIKYNKIYTLSIRQDTNMNDKNGRKIADWYLVYVDLPVFPNFIKSCELHPTGTHNESTIELPDDLPFTHSLPEIRKIVNRYRQLLVFL